MNSSRTCPICGAPVSHTAKACPECGSDEQTGWTDAAYAPQVDLPDPEFNYDEFIKREFFGCPSKTYPVNKLWVFVALALLVTLLLLWL